MNFVTCLSLSISSYRRLSIKIPYQFLCSYFSRFYYYSEEIPLQNEIIKNVLGDVRAPDMWDIESNADLLLINSYEVLSNIRPTVPTTVYLGGIHQKIERNSLSPSIAHFLDNSENVVYVNLNNAVHPLRFRKLLAVLENANVDIIWNSQEEFLNTTARIYQGTDLDQESILGKLQDHLTFKPLHFKFLTREFYANFCELPHFNQVSLLL